MEDAKTKVVPVAWQAEGSDGIRRYVEMPKTAVSMGMRERRASA